MYKIYNIRLICREYLFNIRYILFIDDRVYFKYCFVVCLLYRVYLVFFFFVKGFVCKESLIYVRNFFCIIEKDIIVV